MQVVRISTVRLKLWFSTLLFIGLTLNFSSCKKDDDVKLTGQWTKAASIDAGARSRAVTFSIEGKVYICAGLNGSNGNKFLKDLWVYDEGTNTWINKNAPLPGAARSGAVAFTANGKAYVGLGYDGTNYLKDFYAYDPETNAWTNIADFGANGRIGAIAFSIDNVGYVGTGNDDDSEYKDFSMYNEAQNKWEGKASVPLVERSGAFSFVLGGKGYVGGGSNSGVIQQDLYAYDPLLNNWIAKNDLKDDKDDTDVNDKGYTIARENAATFVINDMAYVVTGVTSPTSAQKHTWEYNPSTDTWKRKMDFEGNARIGAIGYTLNGYGYIAAGNNGSYLTDEWKFFP